jgi:hypothetical protein
MRIACFLGVKIGRSIRLFRHINAEDAEDCQNQSSASSAVLRFLHVAWKAKGIKKNPCRQRCH